MNQFDSENYPSIEPEGLTLGALWAWKRPDLAGTYDPSLYTASYIANKSASSDCGGISSFTLQASGDEFTVSEVSTATKCPTGSYRWEMFITRTSDSAKVRVSTGYWEVFADLAAGPVDNRSHAQTVLDSVEAVIEGTATKEQSSWSIAGRALSLRTYEELRQIRSDYRAEVKAERQSELQKQGKGGTNKILTRFPA